MKKILALLLCLLMAFSLLTACDSKDGYSDTDGDTEEEKEDTEDKENTEGKEDKTIVGTWVDESGNAFVFGKDGSFDNGAGIGTYTVKGNTLTITWAVDGEEPEEYIYEYTVDGDGMTMLYGDGEIINMTRKRSANDPLFGGNKEEQEEESREEAAASGPNVTTPDIWVHPEPTESYDPGDIEPPTTKDDWGYTEPTEPYYPGYTQPPETEYWSHAAPTEP